MNSIFSSSKPIFPLPPFFAQSMSILGQGQKVKRSQTAVWFLWPTISRFEINTFFKKNMIYQCKSYLPSGSLNIILASKCLANPITWHKNETEKKLFRSSETVLRRCGGQPTVKCFKTGKSGRSRAGSSIFSNILRQRRRLNNEASGVTQISHTCSE